MKYELKTVCLAFAFFLFGIFLQPEWAFADDDPECWRRMTPDKPRAKSTRSGFGFPLDYPLNIKVNEILYSVPAAYLFPWPFKTYDLGRGKHIGLEPSEINRLNALQFWFWMPSLRYVERSMLSALSFRPCEAGRPRPGPDTFAVKVVLKKIDTMRNGTVLTPEQMLKHTTEAAGGPSAFEYEPVHGLIRSVINSAPPLIFYRHDWHTNPQLYLQCSLPEHELPYPSCNGDVYDEKKDLYFRIRFPLEALPQWREILSGAQTLIKQWAGNAH